MDLTWMVALAVFGLLFLIAVTVVVALLASQKTRPIGIVFALLGSGICCLLVVGVFFVSASRHDVNRITADVMQEEAEAHNRAAQEAWRQRPIPVDEPSPPSDTPVEPAAVDEDNEATPATDNTPPADEPPSDETDADDAADTEAEDAPAGPEDTAETPDETDSEVTAPPPPEPGTDDESADDDKTAVAQDPADTDTRPATATDPSDGGARPAMVVEPPREWAKIQTGYRDGVYRTVVRTDPLQTSQECREALPKKLEEAVDTFSRTQLGFPLRVRSEDIQRQLVKDYWEESVEITELGTWVRLHALLEIDGPTSDAMRRQHEEAQQELVIVERIVAACVGLAVVLAMLTILFVCLKMDQRTEGQYRGRLGFAAVVVVLIVFAAAGSFLDFVYWDYISPAHQRMAEAGVQVREIPLPMRPALSTEGQHDHPAPRPGAGSPGRDQSPSTPGRYGTSPDSTIIETPNIYYRGRPPHEFTSVPSPPYYGKQDASRLQVHTDWSMVIGTPIALIFLGGVIVLVINRRTRVAGAVVLAVGIAILVVTCA